MQKYIWRCRLQNVSHFIQHSMQKYVMSILQSVNMLRHIQISIILWSIIQDESTMATLMDWPQVN